MFAERRNTFSRSAIVSVSVASKVKGLSLRRHEGIGSSGIVDRLATRRKRVVDSD
jgi:hypothetical protein